MFFGGTSLTGLEFFGLGSVTGVLATILTLIYQFFFRTSGDKTGDKDDREITK
jgi:hypothetical protein